MPLPLNVIPHRDLEAKAALVSSVYQERSHSSMAGIVAMWTQVPASLLRRLSGKKGSPMRIFVRCCRFGIGHHQSLAQLSSRGQDKFTVFPCKSGGENELTDLDGVTDADD